MMQLSIKTVIYSNDLLIPFMGGNYLEASIVDY